MAITPVVNAIRVLERMVEPGELLFAHAVHGAMAGLSTGSLRSPALRVRIEDFVTWANAEAAPPPPAQQVTATSVSDNTGGIHPLSHISAATPRVTKAWVDTGYRTKAIDHGASLGIDAEVVQRDSAVKGFMAIPRRWVVGVTSELAGERHPREVARPMRLIGCVGPVRSPCPSAIRAAPAGRSGTREWRGR